MPLELVLITAKLPRFHRVVEACITIHAGLCHNMITLRIYIDPTCHVCILDICYEIEFFIIAEWNRSAISSNNIRLYTWITLAV